MTWRWISWVSWNKLDQANKSSLTSGCPLTLSSTHLFSLDSENTWACVCVLAYVCMRACACASVCDHVRVCEHVCVRPCPCVWALACVWACVCETMCVCANANKNSSERKKCVRCEKTSYFLSERRHVCGSEELVETPPPRKTAKNKSFLIVRNLKFPPDLCWVLLKTFAVI